MCFFSSTYSFALVYLYFYPRVRLHFYPLVYLYFYPFVRLLFYPFIHSLICSLVFSLIHSSIQRTSIGYFNTMATVWNWWIRHHISKHWHHMASKLFCRMSPCVTRCFVLTRLSIQRRSVFSLRNSKNWRALCHRN